MADLDPRQIAQSGVDPVTGSPLSKETRKALFQSARVSSIVPGRGGALAISPQQKLVDDQQNQLIVKSNKLNQSLQEQINSLREQVIILNNGLTNIGNLIQSDGADERNRLLQEQEEQRKLAESQVRVGAESQLEQKVQGALAAPVAATQQKVEDIFSRVGNALTTLFLGWLGVQGLKALKASTNGDKNKLEEIKDNVISALTNVLRGFNIIRRGFGGVIRAIGSLASHVFGIFTKIITAPFRAMGEGVAKLFGKGAAEAGGKILAKGGLRTALGAIPVLGAIPDFAFAAVDFMQGKTTSGFLGVGAGLASLSTPFTGPFGEAASVGLSLAATGTSVAADFNKPESKPPPPSKQQPQSKPQNKPAPAAAKPLSSTPEVQPQIPIMDTTPAAKTQPSQPAAASTPQTPITPQSVSVNFDLGSSAESVTNNSSSSAATPLKDDQNRLTSISLNAVRPEEIKPATSQTEVGQTPEPKPNVVYRKIGEPQGPPEPPQSNQPITDVPLINSSDPDNFYTLYSRMQYNVIV